MPNKILEAIEQADDTQISEVIDAIIRRNDALFPEWETIFLSLPKKDILERQRVLDWVTKMPLEEKF